MTAVQKFLADFHRLVDVNQQSLLISLASITFNPTAWNIVARHGTMDRSSIRCNALTNARLLEYRNKTLTRLFGSPRRGCYFLAFAIFLFGILRDHLYVLLFLSSFSANNPVDTPSDIPRPKNIVYCSSHPLSQNTLPRCVPPCSLPRYQCALQDQPRIPLLPKPFDTVVPVALFALGQIFVITSTYALGITGTFLGDYFGILMDHRVTG
jgi:hypothetical protein